LVLTVLKEGETLLLYIAATNRVVSTAIVIEREEVEHVYKVQQPVYFISEVLNESKTCYPQVQKMLYAVLIISHKLHHYFDTYPIEVVTEFSPGDILCNKDANGRIIKWALELSPYSLEFRSRMTIKS
jgi:lipopolysaccharide biosynthesis regulator YciM